MPPTIAARHPRDWPVYWFARLEQAVEEGDHAAAAVAQRELARLGVRVHYGRRLPSTPLPVEQRGVARGH